MLLVVCCVLVVFRVSSVERWLLFGAVCCLVPVLCWLSCVVFAVCLFAVRWLLFVGDCALAIGRCSLFVVGCVCFAVLRALFVVCR